MNIIKHNRDIIAAAAIIIIAGFLAYSNTFTVPFLFDDTINILENQSIRRLWPPWAAFEIPADTGIVGRPVINFSLALNYAVSGLKVWSYHLINLIIHILAALTLMGVIRRTILIMDSERQHINSALAFSFGCALLWVLHPVQTQAVTYIIQRCESLMALFFLLTFYCALRGRQSTSPRSWHLAAVVFFLLSAGSKESALVAPFLILLYEWVFLKRNFLKAGKTSPIMYSGFTLVVIVIIFMILSGNTLTSRTENILFTPLDYWITQCQVILHYIYLFLWPAGLAFDYGWPVAAFKEVWPHVVVVMLLVCISFWALWRQKTAGFLGVCFFIILSPTSLLPLPDMAFEHRLYLPSAALIVAFAGIVYGAHRGLMQHLDGYKHYVTAANAGLAATIVFISVLLGFTTYERNKDYRSEMSIWSDTVKKRPDNFRGYQGVGLVLAAEKKFGQSLENMFHALKLRPQNPYVNNDTGFILFLMNRPTEAIPYFEKAIKIKPVYPKAQNNLGAALAQTGNLEQAIVHFSRALKIKPDYSSARNNLAKAASSLKQKSFDR
jgi:protein O-mannosyl-transferase